ncbi:MAG: TetR/AcrR family transcriptional regulator [Actinomycetota bacterium]
MLVREPTGKRVDPRVRRTRALILRAFEELVAEKGHAGLTVQEIAGRATINRATFYAHFRDQYELFDHYVSESFRRELRRRLPESPGLKEETLRALIVAACEYLAGLETACRRTDRRFRPLIEARVQGELYEVLLGWIGELPPERRPADPEITASVVSWAIFGAGLRWSRGGAGLPVEEFARRTLSAIVEGIGELL